MGNKRTVEEKFNEFHNDKPVIYWYFKKFAQELIDRGHNRISGRLIIERIRYEVMISKSKFEEFKINNNYIAHYTRMFVSEYPIYFSKFEFREMKKE